MAEDRRGRRSEEAHRRQDAEVMPMRHLVLCLLLLSAGFVVLFSSSDPLAAYRTSDGGLSLPGDVASRLLSARPTSESVFYVNRTSPYSTLSWSVYEARLSSEHSASWRQSDERSIQNPVSPIGYWLTNAFRQIAQFWSFDWFLGRASATGTDTHYLVPDASCTTTTVASDADCWSHSSGGIGGVGVPGPANL